MSDVQRVLQALEQAEQEGFVLLSQLVELSSHSRDPQGVKGVAQALVAALAPCGLDCEVVPGNGYGDHLVFRTAACAASTARPIVLIGHMDTVFPADHPFRACREEGDRLLGPGVIDMKGGLVVVVQALRALARCHLLARIPLVFIANSDEEVGSPSSRALITREARRCACALVFECGGLQGQVVTGRKGKLSYRLQVQGSAGHAAFVAAGTKASAILALAHLVVELEALNDSAQGVSVNVGVIQGGIGPNTVPAQAEALVDTRMVSPAAALELERRIQRLMANSRVPGTRARAEVVSRREPMPESPGNRKLYQVVARAARTLDQPIREEFRSGVSDANTVAACGRPVLDGLGPIGDHDHSEQEYMVKDSLPQRSRLAAVSLLEIWRDLQRGALG
jgi:glutamate carboxypeptidase